MSSYGFNFDNSYLKLPNELYTITAPISVNSPKIVIVNRELLDSLGVDLAPLSDIQKAELFSGNQNPPGTRPFCQAYAGHQYAHFTLLGDGRAHIIGEHITPDGTRVDCQLKGSGPTPYSRGGDGRAALGPMLREYIISEAMHSLGIPTTRSLAVVESGELVIRERALPGAILTRVASSHIRVGTFEYAATQENHDLLRDLLKYAVGRHFPGLKSTPHMALDFLNNVAERQANLITQWMRVGFIHGVMNTDNMSISGETIDYGPCAFMNEYDPRTVFSYIDKRGRYAFGNQPIIAQWNIARLAESLLPLIHDNKESAVSIATEAINRFPSIYENKYLTMMRSKLGLVTKEKEDVTLINDLLDWMNKHSADYTNTFMYLTYGERCTEELYTQESFLNWHQRWKERFIRESRQSQSPRLLMTKNNPVVIPRNHQVEKALASATEGNIKQLHLLLQALKSPYENSKSIKKYQSPPKPCERIKNTFCGT